MYSQDPVVLTAGLDRRLHYGTGNRTSVGTDTNFRDKEAKFRKQLQNKYVYRVPLEYICDLGKISFPTKINIKICLTLETNMNKLFESDKNLAMSKSGKTTASTDIDGYNIGTPERPDAQIVLLKALMVQYKQLTLNKNFRQYLETILFSARTLQMGVQKTPYQKTYELQTESQDFTVDFQGANRQFDWIEIYLIYDERDKHLLAYDSYNLEAAAKLIKTIQFANISNENSATNTLRYDLGNDLHKHLLYKQFLAWNTTVAAQHPYAIL